MFDNSNLGSTIFENPYIRVRVFYSYVYLIPIMRASILYITILFFILSNSLLGQEKRVWNNTKEIQKQIVFHKNLLNVDSTIYYLDELINIHRNRQNEKELLETYVKKISNLLLFDKYPEAFQLALSTINNYCQESNKIGNCKSCGMTYLYLGELMITLQDYKQGVKYVDMVCEEEKGIMYYHHKANLYRLLELPDSALMISEEGIDWAKKNSKSKDLIAAYNNHGIIARHLNKFDKAIGAFSTAVEVVNSTDKNILHFAYIMGNLGSCYVEIEEYDKAYECLLIDAEGSIKYRAKGSYIQAELSLAEIEVLRKEHKRAINRLKSLLNNYEKHLSVDNKLKLFESFMSIYNSIGDKSSYKLYSEQWIELNKFHFQNQMGTHKTLIEQFNANALKQITQKIELEKQLVDQQLIIQQKVSEQKQLKNWTLIGFLLFTILLGLLLFLRFKAIQAKKTSIKDATLKLAIKEQEILTLKVQEENRNVQVLSHELILKQDFSSNLISQLSQLDNISKPELKSIELFVQNELDVKSTRGLIQQQMGELSNNFHLSLKIKHPDLSKSDIAFAAMIAMNMTNKEIGISKNMSTETIKTTKYRLKKKLNISLSESMDDYLMALLEE